MKLIIRDDEVRRVRYGVRDFQVDDSGTVHVYYPPEVADTHDIEDATETLFGRIVAGEDEASFHNDPDYEIEDLAHEQEAADDLQDYRI